MARKAIIDKRGTGRFHEYYFPNDPPGEIRLLSDVESKEALDMALREKEVSTGSSIKWSQEFFIGGPGRFFGRALKVLPVVGTCVGLACAANEARAGNYGRACAEAAGAFCDPVDYATMAYDLVNKHKGEATPYPGSNPVSAPRNQ